MTATQRLIDELEARRVTEGLTQTQFATKLEVSHGQWVNTRLGKWPLGLSVVAGIRRAYPDLDTLLLDAVAEYVRGEHSEKQSQQAVA